jgi:ribosomal protein S18 acetylase RimI-like enzyme
MPDAHAHGISLREIRESDAESFLALQRQLDEETTMMMLEPDERSLSVNIIRGHVQEALASPNSTIIVADSGTRLVGYAGAVGGGYRRTRHRAEVVIGVLHAHQGRGIGRSLLQVLRSWAREHDISRLELTVPADNDRARRLYESVGFETEGLRRGSLRIDGEMIDELAMALVLLEGDGAEEPAGQLHVRPLRPAERPWLERQLTRLWGSTQVVSRGRLHEASTLLGLVCQAADERVGIATIEIRHRQCELVTLDAFNQGQGAGSALLAAVVEEARRHQCSRLWLITTNDNVRALRFYQRRGFRLVAVHRDAVDDAHRVKPSIPLVGEHGIAIHDELELELLLDQPSQARRLGAPR